MAAPRTFTAGSMSTVATCPHKPVWVVDASCHRVLRKPCPVCHGPVHSSPAVASLTTPAAPKRERR